MTLIKSISGIRGTIGGEEGENFTPLDIVKFITAYTEFIKKNSKNSISKIVIGKDARISGEMVNSIVVGTLLSMGVDVVDVGLSTTPTVEMAVVECVAQGGIIITASHNNENWNALKFLNAKGEFLSAMDGKEILDIIQKNKFDYSSFDKIGKYSQQGDALEKHLEKIIDLDLVDVEAIKKTDFKVAIDGINSTGGIAIPKLLKRLGVREVVELNCEPTGIFAHNPEPLSKNLKGISDLVISEGANVGFAVDPDVDRLAIVMENGEMFNEEYTIVAVSDYVLKNYPGNTVSNLSSSQALKEITEKRGGKYFSAAVGEVNVVEKMKDCQAIIGGEGNGGVIYPQLHYGRDALVGIALFLSYLALSQKKCTELRRSYPDYFISKNKIELEEGVDVDEVLEKFKEKYRDNNPITIDGVKVSWGKEWIHLRKSNTEPIIRIYTESDSMEKADNLAKNIIAEIKKLI